MTTDAAEGTVTGVTLHFDPACPWTWRTSRWLVAAAATRGVPVTYAAFELSAGGPLEEVPEDYRAGAAASRLFLRGVSEARRRGLHELIGRWYTAYGTALWDEQRAATAELVRATLRDTGGSELLAALDDERLDAETAAARAEALELAGDDVGSPVTVWHIGDRRRGFFGPVVAPEPAEGRGDVVWDLVVAAGAVPELFELKTRRTNSPA